MIEETIESIANELSPSTGDNLLGMDYDIRYYFETSDFTKFISLKQTDDNKCMFIISLEATGLANDMSDVTDALRQAWDCLMYSYFEATSIQKYKEKTILRFVTVIAENQFYVTGKAVVSGVRYQQLAKDYESNFTKLPNA